jgi:hypothetical protein
VNTAGIGFVVDAQMFRIVTAVANLSAVSAEETGIPVTFVDGVCALLATAALLSVVCCDSCLEHFCKSCRAIEKCSRCLRKFCSKCSEVNGCDHCNDPPFCNQFYLVYHRRCGRQEC